MNPGICVPCSPGYITPDNNHAFGCLKLTDVSNIANPEAPSIPMLVAPQDSKYSPISESSIASTTATPTNNTAVTRGTDKLKSSESLTSEEIAPGMQSYNILKF